MDTGEVIIILPWYFIPRVLKLVSVELYVRNGYVIIIIIINVHPAYSKLHDRKMKQAVCVCVTGMP